MCRRSDVTACPSPTVWGLRTSLPPSDRLGALQVRLLHLRTSLVPQFDVLSAAEMFLSTSTVKTHMRHIYEKLDAHRRAEAVERARELGLLGPSTRSGR